MNHINRIAIMNYLAASCGYRETVMLRNEKAPGGNPEDCRALALKRPD